MMQGSLAHKVRVLRAERGLTLREAASLTGVAKETISDIERGLRHPHDPTLAKIARGYGVPVEELLEEPVPLGEAPREAEDPDLELLPGYLRFLKQQTESMRTRWETAIKENTVEPGAWYEATEVAMDLAKRFVDTVPLPLYATEDRGPLREEGGETVADALGSLMSLRTTLDVAYHACESRFEEKGDLDDVAEDLDRDDVVDQRRRLRERLREQHRRFREEWAA
jgi:transcriptional regulator with XRE-family HTH domain